MGKLRLYTEIKSLSEVLGEEGFQRFRKSAGEYAVVEKFSEIFPDLSNIVKPQKIEKNILFLKVENSVWRNELRFKQEIMKERINKYFKEKIVKSIRFTN